MDYRGHDSIPIIVGNYFYHSRKKENARILNSFKHQIDFQSILEDVVVFCSLRTQYENHTVRHYVMPPSDRIKFYSSEQVQGHRQAMRDSKKYGKMTYEYPRKESVRSINCPCKTGARTCPNCRATKIVSCPECHQRRSGKCRRCSGNGKFQCDLCGGNRKCIKCRGSCQIACPGCNHGYVTGTRTVKESCGSCGGRGYIMGTTVRTDWILGPVQSPISVPCRNCRYGEISKTESFSEKHSRCYGTGQITCDKCAGAGQCDRCDGTGYLACGKCQGGGACGTCSGKGVKECPTCDGEGQVSCPLCGGSSNLTAYSSDIYQYEDYTDSGALFPPPFDESLSTLSKDFLGAIRFANFEESCIRSQLGMINPSIMKTMASASVTFNALLERARTREMLNRQVDWVAGQDLIYHQLQERLAVYWNRKSDSYNTKFTKTVPQEDRSSKVLPFSLGAKSNDVNSVSTVSWFRNYELLLVPVSETRLSLDGKDLRIIGCGTKEHFQLRIASSLAEVPFADDLINRDTARAIYPAKIEERPSALRKIVTLGAQGIKKETKLVMMVGDDEHFKLNAFLMICKSIVRNSTGTIDDRLYLQISSNSFDCTHVQIGSSAACSIRMDEDRTIILLNIHASSFASNDSAITRLVEGSDLIIFLARKGESLKRVESNKDKTMAIIIGPGADGAECAPWRTNNYTSDDFESMCDGQFMKVDSEIVRPMTGFLFAHINRK
jgi:hypothetical protein